MRFDRESWRKLYVAESAEHAFLPLAVRGVRDYLLRFAAEDGTLLPSTQDPVVDLAFLIRAKPSEHELVGQVVSELQRVGYMKLTRGRLWLPKFEEAQLARSPGAKRQAAYKARKAGNGGGDEGTGGASPSMSPEALPGGVTGDVSGDASLSVTNEETRNDETTTTAAPVVVVGDFEISCPADLTLTPAQIGTIQTGNPIPDGAISWLTRRFIANYQADLSDKRTLVVWRKCLSKAVSGGWNDGRIKSQYLAQQKAEKTDDTGGYGRAEDWQ